MNLLGPAFSVYLQHVDRWLQRSGANPAACQRRVFHQLLDRAKDTKFGRQHGFASIQTHADFVQINRVRELGGRFVGR